MCGIVGYVGERNSLDVLMGGLRRLEYRGYDSAGVAIVDDDGAIETAKRAGKLQVLADELEANPLHHGGTGIGHTRWATHGGPTDRNAHPHLGDEGRLALIHNGIIENFADLKNELLAEGLTFESETDTEVAAVLLGKEYRATGDLRQAFRNTVSRLDGAFTLLAVHRDEPGVVVGARRNSPLVIGLGEGENFLGSDVAAFVEFTKRAVAIGQDQIVEITADARHRHRLRRRARRGRAVRDRVGCLCRREGRMVVVHAQRGVASSPRRSPTPCAAASSTTRSSSPSSRRSATTSSAAIRRITVIACGTAAYAGMVAKYAIEQWSRVPVEVELSHEFRYREPVLDEHTLVVSISQSGETMDTLMAVKYARETGRSHDLGLQHAGCDDPARIRRGRLHARRSRGRGRIDEGVRRADRGALPLRPAPRARARHAVGRPSSPTQLAELQAVPEKLQAVLGEAEKVEQLAHWMADTRSVLFLGRHVGFPIAMEGALKLKELAYIHAEGFAAGELKHGPIALIEPGQPVFVVVPSPRGSANLHPKVVSNIQEIRARGARVIAIAEAGDAAVLPFADEVLRIPLAAPLFEPLLAVVPLQIFAMELAQAKGLDVDQPRNLAKSVTVE